jgi:Primase C terminal 2 (PriCT-2)
MRSPLRFSFAINSAGRDKDWDFKLLAGKFKDKQGTIADVMAHVRSGYALCAGLLNGKWRSKANVTGSQWVLLDIDNSKGLTDADGNPLDEEGRPIRIGRQFVDIHGAPIDKPDGRKQGKVYDHQLSIPEAIAHPFIHQNAALIYTSASHKPDWHKFRLVFLLPELVQGSDTIEALVRYLMAHLPHDPACKDASRVFYGNTRAEFPLINPAAVLPTEWIEQAKAAAEIARAEHERRLEEAIARRAQLKATAEQEGWDFDALVDQALSYIPPRQEGSGNYDECRQVLMALHSHYGDAAEAIAERWSPSIAGSSWNIRLKFKSFRRSEGIGIGTLFHFARQYGFKFPEQVRSEPGDKDYLEWLEEQFKVEAARAEAHADEDFLSKIFRYFGGGKPKRKTRKRIVIERKATEQSLGEYAPGEIPEFRKSGTAYKIQYRPGQEAALYKEAIALGYHILDISPTGSGKTQRSGNLDPRDFTFDIDGQSTEAILVYLGNDHRNPKTASVEANFCDVPNRHNGMAIDKTRKTALDKPYIINPKAEHGPLVERLPGNCHKATEFATAQQKGLTWATETATANPICQSCPYFGTCGDPNLDHHPGSGFRALRAESLKSPRIRMSPDQYPRDWMSDRTINIIDEALQTIQVTDTLIVALKDHDGAWATLEQEEPALHHKLAGMRRELRRLLTGKEPRYGYSRDEIIKALNLNDLHLSNDEIERIQAATSPSLAELFGMVDRIDTSEFVRAIANLKAKLLRRNAKLAGFETEALRLKRELATANTGILFGGIDERVVKAQLGSLTLDIKALKDEIKFLNGDLTELEDEYKSMKIASKRVQQGDRARQSEALANTFVCWLAPFFEIVLGTLTGTLSIQYGKLLVHLSKDQHRRIIHEALANIFLDATATAESLSFRTGIAAENILVCECIHDEGAAVHHVQVPDFGLAGKKRADSTDERIKAAVKGVESAHEGCSSVTFDHLSKSAVTGAKGVHFRDSRGENSFMTNDVFVHVGLPMPNIGALRIEYEILAQNSANPLGFDAYYQDACDAELRQEMGRDRALRRTGNIFHYWLTDLELPLEAIATPAAELSLDAASQADITRRAIAQAMAALAKEGGSMTQVAIARAADVSQGWVSKFFAGMGGWRVWRAIITGLIKGSIRASNNLDLVPESLSEDERWVAQEYLSLLVLEFEADPVGVVEAVAAIALGFGSEAWARILAGADRVVVAKLLGLTAIVLPEWARAGVAGAIV